MKTKTKEFIFFICLLIFAIGFFIWGLNSLSDAYTETHNARMDSCVSLGYESYRYNSEMKGIQCYNFLEQEDGTYKKIYSEGILKDE